MTNVRRKCINIAQRVMSQADAGQILASNAFYGILAAKSGENVASRWLRPLGPFRSSTVSLDMYIYVDPSSSGSWAGEPSKQHERRLVQEHIRSQLQRIEGSWSDGLLGVIPPEGKGTSADPELRVTLLYCAPNPGNPEKHALRVSAHRYSRNRPWSTEPPPRVYFEQGKVRQALWKRSDRASSLRPW